MSSGTLFAVNLLIQQSIIPHQLYVSCNDKCSLYIRFFEHAYTACVST